MIRLGLRGSLSLLWITNQFSIQSVLLRAFPALTALTIIGLALTPFAAIAQDGPSDPLDASFAGWKSTFSAIWQADSACAQNEGRNEYLAWIHSFYVNDAGWLEQTATVTGTIKNGTKRARVVAELGKLGMRIAAEWAKPNFCRRISTFGQSPSLTSISQTFQSAAASDPGDGTEIQSAIRQVEQLLDNANVAEVQRKGSS
jgi:hypothetical protein